MPELSGPGPVRMRAAGRALRQHPMFTRALREGGPRGAALPVGGGAFVPARRAGVCSGERGGFFGILGLVDAG
jgi:hypothetical protein